MTRKARPILFSTSMVQALLRGDKTQTRRVATHPLVFDNPRIECLVIDGDDWWTAIDSSGGVMIKCPYGKVGDLLYVRESWRPEITGSSVPEHCDISYVNVQYPADNHIEYFGEDIPDEWTYPERADKGNVPSIHMPKWASRLTLEIINIKVERLFDISHDDSIAEGCAGCKALFYSPHDEFFELWRSINGQESLDSNPWVWAIEFKLHKCNYLKLPIATP